jgi:very-short-patch-repair endonuclease
MGKLLTPEEFICKAKEIHSDKYDYSKVEYINSREKIIITCPIHGDFYQKPNYHLNGNGCRECGGNVKVSFEDFVKQAREIHGDKFIYHSDSYVSKNKKVKITCPIHGDFWQVGYKHIHNKNGCRKCKVKTTNQFIKEAKQIHGNFYDYSKVEYTYNNKNVIITCPIHGDFCQQPINHLMGRGCNICKASHGEREINNILLRNKIKFKRQKTFKTCKNERVLPFDFYLKDYNILIEFDGEQHFRPMSNFGGVNTYNKIKKCDNIKTKWAEENKIFLLRISYKDDIFQSLKKVLPHLSPSRVNHALVHSVAEDNQELQIQQGADILV